LSKILIPPTRFRPVYFSKLFKNKEGIDSNPQNFYFLKIIKINQQLLLALGIDITNSKKLTGFKFFSELESTVFNLLDNSHFTHSNNSKNPIGIRQQLEQKLGLFRMHIMGKRVNYSARSVVVSDPFLKSNEVGFPKICADKVNISFVLDHFNLPYLKKILKKKTYKNMIEHSKIKMIETIFGEKINLCKEKIKIQTLQLVQICRKYFEYYVCNRLNKFGLTRIFRILKSGDLVLLNRQPSLHRASVMAHKVIIKKKTKCLSLNYINCNPYNADFDGDEMNVHVIHNNIAKAEAMVLSMANNHTKIPTHSTPIRSLIQDHIVSAVFLTKKDNFFNQNTFFHLLCSVFNQDTIYLKSYCPAIIKPKTLWTGKQLISVVIKSTVGKKLNIVLEARNKIPRLMFGQDETNVLIRNGELLRGVLDGSQLGRNKYGIIHALHEKYGSCVADMILTTLSAFLTLFQRNNGHTAGLKDLIISKKIDKIRTQGFCKEKIIRKIIMRKILSRQGFFSENKNLIKKNLFFCIKIVSFFFNQKTIIDQFISCVKSILIGISTNLIENNIPGSLERNLHWNGFLSMTLSGSKGSSINVFQICTSLGQTELEGKCIPRGHGAKTLPVFFPYEISANANGFIEQRFLTGLSSSSYFFHCMAGREGLLDTAIKTAQSGYIQRSLIKHLESLKINYDLTVRMESGGIGQMIYSRNGLSPIGFEFIPFLPWFLQNIENNLENEKYPKLKTKLEILKRNILIMPIENLKKIQELSDNFYKKRKILFRKSQIFYIENNLSDLFQKNLCEPGESIGIIAGQSIGEPCTQMTLNTFHFAGKLVSSYNLGIPRLREILLVASKYPRNPTMSIYFKKDLDFKTYFLMEKRFKKIFLSDIIQTISSYEVREHYKSSQILKIRLIPKNRYKHQLSLSTSFIINQFKSFLKNINNNIPILKLDNTIRTENKNKENDNIFFSLGLKSNWVEKKSKIISHPKLSGLIDLGYSNIYNQTFNFCIKETQNILSSFVDFKEKTIHLNGINFYAVWLNDDLIDINRIFTNDIYALMLTYGIEAARNALSKELETIFQIQGILINKHHIDLISDYMTRLGTFRPFNRMGMNEEKGFQRITYETALRFITESAIDNTLDKINSPSSSITMGKICKSGTGYFDIMYRT
jgi:DNA-directed RNA polymerase I subunit RPA1